MHEYGLLQNKTNSKGATNLYAPFIVPGTNQNTCYDNTSALASCPNASDDFFGQDATYDKSPLFFITATYQGAAAIMDSLVRVWSLPDTQRTWSDANTYCSSKSSLYHTWRLPTLLELSQIVDAAKSAPAVDTTFFTDMQSASYWTSDAAGAGTAWTVNFADGSTTPVSQTAVANTICTESYSTYSGEYLDYGDGAIADTRTNTMWQKSDFPAASWESALAQCEQSQVGGYTDWRLPTKNDLQTVIDPASASLWPTVFSSHAGSYWSSTTRNDAPASAWVVLSDKQTAAAAKTASNYFRCARRMAQLPVGSVQTLMSGSWTATVNGAAVTAKIVNVPFYNKSVMGSQIVESFIGGMSAEVTVAASPSYSYHPTGSSSSSTTGANVAFTHGSNENGLMVFLGASAGQSLTGEIRNYLQEVQASVSAARTAKSATQQDYAISGLWTGDVMGETVAADLRAATYTSGGQTVAYFNGYLSVPYDDEISGYPFTGFMESDGSVFMVRNAINNVYIFEGARSGDTITGALRNYDQILASNLTFTRVAGSDLIVSAVSSFVPLLLFDE
jgi:hypothetical protein